MAAYLTDGFSTTITFAAGALTLKEKSVTPPGLDAGGANDTTSMRNTTYRTMQPKKLLTMTPMKATCFYNPVIYSDILAQIKVVQLITVNFSDGSHLAFYGWLDKISPGEVKEGEPPTLELEVIPGNQDASFNEQAPVYSAS